MINFLMEYPLMIIPVVVASLLIIGSVSIYIEYKDDDEKLYDRSAIINMVLIIGSVILISLTFLSEIEVVMSLFLQVLIIFVLCCSLVLYVCIVFADTMHEPLE